MNMRTNIHLSPVWALIFAVWAISGCSTNTEKAHEGPTAEEVAEAPATIAATAPSPTRGTIECTGVVDVPPTSRNLVYARTDAYVAEVKVLEGSHVHKGDVIMVLQSPHFARLQRDWGEAKAEQRMSRAALDRLMGLKGTDAVSQKQLEQAQFDAERANARYDGLRRELSAIGFGPDSDPLPDDLVVRSPINGAVTFLGVSNGQRVSPETHLATLIDRSHMHIEVQVPGVAAGLINEGDTFHFTVPERPDTLLGRIHLVNDAVDLTTGTVNVHGHFANETDSRSLRVGQRVFVRLGRK